MYILAPTTGGGLAGLAHRGHLMVHKIMNIDDTYRSGSQLVEQEEMITFENPAYNKSVENSNSKLGVNKTLSSLRTSNLTGSGRVSN